MSQLHLPLLQKILQPVTLDEFSKEYWGKKPMLVKREDTSFYDSLATLEDINTLFNKPDISQVGIGVVKEHERIPAKEWISGVVNDNASVDPLDLLEWYEKGYTIMVIPRYQHVNRLTHWLEQFELETQLPIFGKLFLTPPGAISLHPHFDSPEIIVLQLGGSKHWKLYHTPLSKPVDKQTFRLKPHELGQPILETTLNPGDLLYFPSGNVHSVHTSDSWSAHLTIGVMPPRRFEFINEIQKLTADQPNFNQAVSSLTSDGFPEDLNAKFSSMLKDLIETMDWDKMLENKFQKTTEKTSPRNSQPFRNAE